jgi:hypothetical protein
MEEETMSDDAYPLSTETKRVRLSREAHPFRLAVFTSR